MKAYIVEDQYRNNQVLVYAVDAIEARTAAKNKKELSHVEWIDLQVRRAKYADRKDHLTIWEVSSFKLVIELNELVNGWSYEISNELLYEDNWKDFLNRLDSTERKNILAVLNQFTKEKDAVEIEDHSVKCLLLTTWSR